MRKMIFGRQLSRGRKSREALFRSLIKALILNGKISTTKAKAKAVQNRIDKLVSKVKKDSISARREIAKTIGNDRKMIEYLFGKIGPAFKQRKGGYTRIIFLPRRQGDGAEMARIEWTEKVESNDMGKEIKKGKPKAEVKNPAKKEKEKETKAK
jgi:large subunit ribosomal protein L17